MTREIIEHDIKIIVDGLASENVTKDFFLGPICLMKRLHKKGIQSKLVVGYMIMENEYSFKHIWVTINGIIIDINSMVVEKIFGTENLPKNSKLAIESPEDIYRVDSDKSIEHVIEFEDCLTLILREDGSVNFRAFERFIFRYGNYRMYKLLTN